VNVASSKVKAGWGNLCSFYNLHEEFSSTCNSKQIVKKINAYLRTAIMLEKSLEQKYFEVVDAQRKLDIGEREAVLELFVISAGMPSRKLKGQSLKAAKGT
jgi:hypothetical protein